MAQERLTMRKISEVLRLKWECGLSNRAIARSCSISHSTVGDYLGAKTRYRIKGELQGIGIACECLFQPAPLADASIVDPAR